MFVFNTKDLISGERVWFRKVNHKFALDPEVSFTVFMNVISFFTNIFHVVPPACSKITILWNSFYKTGFFGIFIYPWNWHGAVEFVWPEGTINLIFTSRNISMHVAMHYSNRVLF